MNLTGHIQAVPKVDKTLTLDGESADAKVVGEKFNETNKRIDDMSAEGVSFDKEGTWTKATDLQGAVKDVLKQTEVYEASGYMANHWSGENNYVVVGRICILNFNIQNGLSPAPSNAVFVTDLPKPKKAVCFNAWKYDNDYTFEMMPCGITTNGELVIHKELTYQHSFAGSVAYLMA